MELFRHDIQDSIETVGVSACLHEPIREEVDFLLIRFSSVRDPSTDLHSNTSVCYTFASTRNVAARSTLFKQFTFSMVVLF